MPIKFTHKGDFRKTEGFLTTAKLIDIRKLLEHYGRRGVEELKAATPEDSGKTADSWTYEIKTTNKGYSITWTNTNENDGIPIVVLIQYGHGTGTGGYVPPFDFINPTMNPLFDDITEEVTYQLQRGGLR